MNTVLGRAEHLFVMLLGYLISLVFGSLFLLGIVSTESKIYVVRNQPFDGLVESFPDAVSLFGPEIFHRDGYLVTAYPLTACQGIEPPPFVNTSTRDFNKSSPLSFFSYFALIQRGECDFDSKVLNAQRSGYTGVIVFNTIDDKIFPMNGRKHIDQIMIPSVMVDKKAGLKLMNYSVNNRSQEFMINMVSFYGLPLKYILLSLLIVVGVSLLILVISFVVHLCRFWRRIHRGRLSRRHLRQLVIKRFTKGLDSYDVCSICLEDYIDRDKLRLLPCQHAFHMKCIDPWLLCNRRRCPICNQVVELQGAPSVPVENETEVYNNELLRYLPRRLYNFIRRNSYERNDRRLSVDSQQSSGYYEAGGERTPLLSTDATTQHHACNDAGVHNSLLQPQFPETQSSFQVDDDDDELVDPKSPLRSNSSPPAIESQSLFNDMHDAFSISCSTSSTHLLHNVKSTSQSTHPSFSEDKNVSLHSQTVIKLAPTVISMAETMTMTSGEKSLPTTVARDTGEDDLLITDVNVEKIA